MRTPAAHQSRSSSSSRLDSQMLVAALLTGTLLFSAPVAALSPSQQAVAPATSKSAPAQQHKTHARRNLKKPEPVPVAQTPPPPPMPKWPINDSPSPASVVWNANGLRINASNSSLQQILSEVSTETGTKVEGLNADQRVYGEYGPGNARDVLSQLLQGSGYNVLLAGDIGQGAPRELVLSPRSTGPSGATNTAMNRPQQESDEDVPEQPEEQPQPPIQAPQMQNTARPGFGPGGPGGPVRTPQQVMEEMQQRQILQQQQLQQQQQQEQQQNPQQ